ncbi:MAG TPA: hypothetical protein H9838_09185 [Candidatus Acutalibacter pullistercoris]|uniref:MORN repeat protein n=1 Tax=Candidatus Acutalibacter pullistercoris TaxID=2838418 RepID=A0A9D1YEE0_9FIRM|nr:hypothetical protein [Candidatus Acutalibacter pullistercoris]
MENTITSNAMSASLLSRDVYGVCFPQRDSLDVLHSEFAAAREQFFSGGRKTVKVGRSQVVKGFDGKLKGKLTRRGLYWKKTATGMAGERAIALEEVFEQKGGWMLVTRDFRNVIVSRAFFNKSHIWLKSEYYEPWDAACARVIFKPGDLGDTVERFDWDPVNKRYDSTLLYPVTYQPGTPEESLLTARFGQPQLLVATAQGQFGYCPQQEAKDRQQAREQIQEGTILLMPAWEVKDGEIAKPQKEEDEESAISFTTLEDYAQLLPAQEEAPQEEAQSPAGEEAPEKEASPAGEEAPEKEAQSPAGEGAPQEEVQTSAGEGAPQEEANSSAGEKAPQEEAQSPAGEGAPQEEAQSPAGEEAAGEEPLPQEDAAILQAARQAAQSQPQLGEVQPGEGTLVVQGKEAGRAAAYDGAYAQGKRQGFGSAYYQDGALRYAGFWNQGRKEGLGVSFRDGDHALHVARWTDGKPGEFVSLFDGQGNLRYSGYMKDGKKDGAGVSPAPQGEGLYVGKWKDGESLEVGSAFDREGNLLYYGQWKDGKRHGRGTAFDKTGAVVFDGEWKEDGYFNGVLYQKWGGEDPAGEPEGTDPDWDL